MALLFTLVLFAFVSCGNEGEGSGEELEVRTDALLPDRSFAITDHHLLQGFPLERVLKQLVTQAGIPGFTHLDLFQQFWDTQNPAPGAGTPGPHCDDHITWQGQPGLNEFPWKCPREEGFQAKVDPFGKDPLYIPIGLFNRFDLAPANGSHCGEHRIVYGMKPDHKLARGRGRSFMIFEAILPNPQPEKGLSGCLDVAKFWADLSFQPDNVVISQLEKFYFHGITNFAPVVHVNHYGLMLGAAGYACSTGQIRTNQFNEDPWTMREYKLAFDCRCSPCKLLSIPMTVKTNPYADLFNPATIEPLEPDLWNTLIAGIGSLSSNNANTISYSVDDSLNAAESTVDGFSDYTAQASPNAGLHAAIQGALPANSPLTSTNIIDRALSQSCAGCHLLSDGRNLGNGITWPNSLGFVHVSEFIQNGKYPISQALDDVFIPFRKKILISYLDDPEHFNFGGSRCHIKMPPELQMDTRLCADAERKPEILTRGMKSEVLRSLRTEWEGRRLLGRSSGH